MTVAKRNRVTLADVAKAANVSRSTASRALNNSPRISRETTARIKKIADSMGFIPNAQGRALAVGRNETIAILITEPLDELFDDPTYAMFISGITEKLSESSYLPVLLQASTDFEHHRVQQHLERRSFDAVIDISPYANNYLLEEMYKLRIPCVMLGQMEDRSYEGFSPASIPTTRMEPESPPKPCMTPDVGIPYRFWDRAPTRHPPIDSPAIDVYTVTNCPTTGYCSPDGMRPPAFPQ